ncbi:MAG: DNRLRE domain-containing protein [Planctomycetaceae bacterium]|nr:DNRLRE domain-containing protein [Phycisphaerales bacterium]MCE2653096.1 DNRLRE domain-containing protein [Planctomycetaceae bacterium]
MRRQSVIGVCVEPTMLYADLSLSWLLARVRPLLAALVVLSAPGLAAAQQWVTPAVSAPRVQRVVFPSSVVGGPVSYHVYTPPAYDTQPTQRFPVLYWLHGSNSVLAGIPSVAAWFDAAIANGRIRPMIIVFPNGLPYGMWCNSVSGATRVEDILIQNVLPDVDARFRTMASRSGRIIEGFSMGGYGAGRIGFRHSHLFGGISMLGAGPLQQDFLQEPPGSTIPIETRLQIYQDVYNNSPTEFLARSPWQLASVHRDALLNAGMPIRQMIGAADFTLPANLEFRQRMADLGIPVEFVSPPRVGHDVLGLFNAYGENLWSFYHSVFGATPGTCPTCVPLTELGTGRYLGQYEGGLYPGGASAPPPSHQAAIVGANRAIRPVDAGGRPTPDGLVGFLAIGMSNATMEFGALEGLMDFDPARNARVVAVNAAAGSHPIELINNPTEDYWTLLEARLAGAGLSPAQVQVVWIKQAFGTPPTTAFPAHAEALQEQYVLLVNQLRQRFVNLRLALLSSRIYGGYSSNPMRAEPLSYETGFAVKWLIEAQINGSDPRLRFTGTDAPAPVLAWGPYIWANGTTVRSDGLSWQIADFASDRIHPNDAGRLKVAQRFMTMLTEAGVGGWYQQLAVSSVVSRQATADTTLDATQPNTAFGGLTSLRVEAGRNVALLRFDLAGLSGRVLHAKMVVQPEGGQSVAISVWGPVSSAWNEASVTWNTAPSIPTTALSSLPDEDDFGGGASTWSFDVTSAVRGAAGGPLSLAIASTDSAGESVMIRARESTSPPRLVLLMDRSDIDGDGAATIDDVYVQQVFPADVNGDGVINQADMEALAAWYRRFEAPHPAPPGR